jgi:hypothetical protein
MVLLGGFTLIVIAGEKNAIGATDHPNIAFEVRRVGIKQSVVMFGVSILVNFYTTFVLMELWNWFAVAALKAPEISYWVMYGLVLILQTTMFDPELKDEERWKWLETVLTRCIPEEKRSEVMEEVQEQKSEMTSRVGLAIFSKGLSSTVALGLGWVVHVFLV